MNSDLKSNQSDPDSGAMEHDSHVEPTVEDAESAPRSGKRSWLVAFIAIGAVVLFGLLLILLKSGASDADDVNVNVKTEASPSGGEPPQTGVQTVKLSPEALEAAHIEVEGVTQRPAVALFDVTGTVEVNPQQAQSVTPLVPGRVEQVHVSIGDHVSAGQALATLTSTEVADLYGKWRAAETRLDLAQRNLGRVTKAENRVGVLQAKAKLDEAEATLKRTRRLIELGAGAGKDLISAETAYKSALADYEYQRSIPLNKEIQEARAEVETARIETQNLRQSLQVLGVGVNSPNASMQNVSRVSVVAPLGGVVTERQVNPGTGVQAGQAMFTLSNISSVWVTANVPQQQLGQIRIGTPAEVRTGSDRISARVTYIDTQLNEDTRTARVRISVANPGERLKAGMFVDVGFQAGVSEDGENELVVPTDAIQRIGARTVVFIPKKDEPGEFEVREIRIGGDVSGYTQLLEGLELGEKVVTKGSFTLKAQLQKGSIVDDDDQ